MGVSGVRILPYLVFNDKDKEVIRILGRAPARNRDPGLSLDKAYLSTHPANALIP